MSTEREEMLSKEILFEDALKSAGKSNYLGDRAVVESLLRVAVGEVMEGLSEVGDQSDFIQLMKKPARRVGNILLGNDKDFSLIRNWNRPGGIDVFSAKWLGSAETTPNRIMEHCMVKLFNEMLDIAEYAAEEDVMTEQWAWQINPIISKYVGVFMGQDLPSQAALELSETEPEILNVEE